MYIFIGGVSIIVNKKRLKKKKTLSWPVSKQNTQVIQSHSYNNIKCKNFMFQFGGGGPVQKYNFLYATANMKYNCIIWAIYYRGREKEEKDEGKRNELRGRREKERRRRIGCLPLALPARVFISLVSSSSRHVWTYRFANVLNIKHKQTPKSHSRTPT